MTLRHAGFDALDMAFFGQFSEEALAQFEAAKKTAAEREEPIWRAINTPSGSVEVQVNPTGAKGGWKYSMTTGDAGFILWVKEPKDGRDAWACRVSCRAGLFLEQPGFRRVLEHVRFYLRAMGWRPAIAPQGHGESVSRVDFALDFQDSGFVLDPGAVVSKAQTEAREELYVRRSGRRCTYIRVGSVSRRQICIYDKTKEAREKRKPWWFERWGLPWDTPERVWRVEVRLGKEHLRDEGVRTPADLCEKIEALAERALSATRLVERSDQNVTRCPDLPFWARARAALARALSEAQEAFETGRISRIVLEQRKLDLRSQWQGLIAARAALDGTGGDALSLMASARNFVKSLEVELFDNEKRWREKYAEKREKYGLAA